MLSVAYDNQAIEIDLDYSALCLTDDQAARVLSLLQTMMVELTKDSGKKPIASLDMVSREDMHDLWTRNASVPETSIVCVHELFTEVALRQPQAPGVCAWDGEWTYQELDDLSTRLAYRLIRLGVGPDAIVPLCFEKSKWVPVVVLAVMKAGGASVAIDTSQPEDRLRSIISQVDPALVLCSPTKRDLADRLSMGIAVLVVFEESMVTLPAPHSNQTLPTVDPSSSLYVIFTSGSTGTPKGVVITHQNYTSAIRHQQADHGFKPTSRVFDFASYAFDVSWSNVLHTLTCGACLCIPSDEDRKNNLSGAIKDLRATHVDVTPSVARLLPTEILQSIDTLVLGGEKLLAEDAQRWSQFVTVKNPYGPSECTPTATITTVDPNVPFSGSIGHGIGLNTWVVDPVTGKLSPIGSTGELLLEGPLVGAGYLADPVKTTAAFLVDPAWLLRGGVGPNQPGRRGRLYKTGDLVKYARDGTLTFVGRKDAQIKINGQRVELGEIDFHVASCLAEVNDRIQVITELVTPMESTHATLVTFLSVGDAHGMAREELLSFTNEATSELEQKLATRLPAHMVPTYYIALPNGFPMTATGKVDRRGLRQHGKSLTWEQLNSTASSSAQGQRQPTTAMEIKLQALWASVLEVDPARIGLDESFLRMGGDSVQGMKLVGAARQDGLSLSVADILRHPRLSDMAKTLHTIDGRQFNPQTAYEPFSLLPTSETKEDVLSSLTGFGINSEAVDDILPVTDQQARHISMTYTGARGLLLYHTLDGDGAPDVPMMRAMLSHLVVRFDTLRTVFVPYKDTFLQIVLETPELDIPVYETEDESLSEYTEKIRKGDMERELRYGMPLTKFIIIHQTREQKYRVIARLSHAQHDGMSILKMWNAFEGIYNDTTSEEVRSSSFSRYMLALSSMDREAARKYWRDLLKGSSMTVLKKRTGLTLGYGSSPSVAREIAQSEVQSNDFTFSTVLKAAWAYVLARHTANPDIVFSNLTHGRTMPGTEDIFGACVNVIPTRVVFAAGWRVRDLIGAVNAQQTESMQYENLGSREIVRGCTDWPKWSYAGSVVYHHNFDNGVHEAHDRGMHQDDLDLEHPDVDNVDVHVTSTTSGENMRIELSFAADVVSEDQAEQLATELIETIVLFYHGLDMPIPSPQELRALPASLPISTENDETASIRPTMQQIVRARYCPAAARAALDLAWAEVFGGAVSTESKNQQSFFELGGDLISASVVSAYMERAGYRLSIEDIFENPTWYLQLCLLSKQRGQKGRPLSGLW